MAFAQNRKWVKEGCASLDVQSARGEDKNAQIPLKVTLKSFRATLSSNFALLNETLRL
jgi:hypothetical protein